MTLPMESSIQFSHVIPFNCVTTPMLARPIVTSSFTVTPAKLRHITSSNTEPNPFRSDFCLSSSHPTPCLSRSIWPKKGERLPPSMQQFLAFASALTFARSFNADDVILVEVGSNDKKDFIHKGLFALHSEYFATALKGPWREAIERKSWVNDVNSGGCACCLSH